MSRDLTWYVLFVVMFTITLFCNKPNVFYMNERIQFMLLTEEVCAKHSS